MQFDCFALVWLDICLAVVGENVYFDMQVGNIVDAPKDLDKFSIGHTKTKLNTFCELDKNTCKTVEFLQQSCWFYQ